MVGQKSSFGGGGTPERAGGGKGRNISGACIWEVNFCERRFLLPRHIGFLTNGMHCTERLRCAQPDRLGRVAAQRVLHDVHCFTNLPA